MSANIEASSPLFIFIDTHTHQYKNPITGFKKRAELLQEHLNKLTPGLKYVLNPEKPTKGAFIVKTEKGDTTLFSITGLTRPFAPLKALDFAEVAKEVAAKL